MAIVTGDRYLSNLVKFVEKQTSPLLDGSLILKLNPVGLHYVQSRLESLQELEGLIAGAPVDYLRAYISDLGDHRALEQLRRILRLLTSLKVVSVLPPPHRDPTPLSLLPFGRLKFLELRGCDLSTSAARGLLELRNTLEKIIVHNSTDALRHVFASRLVDIKESQVWSKLLLVSCPCNELVLMDESLQLLPSVETLDLSRNRFAKVDNLRKCTRLKHLDLGFNHLRSISSLTEVSCSIVKLVLRNNALTSLRGIETFMSVEGLDLSYNVISNLSELEILSSLPSLESLWLEGNPICCAPWYRAQVFSLFVQHEKLILDDRRITTRESWKRQIVLASRLKRPAGFGFYCPAKDNDEEEGAVNMNRTRLSRVASIENEQQRRCISEAFEQDAATCEGEIQSREEIATSEGEAEVVDLMNRVEFMKKEHSVLWLREFKDWMDHSSETLGNDAALTELNDNGRDKYMENREGFKQLGESSGFTLDMNHASGDETGTNMMESENSFCDGSVGPHDYRNAESVIQVTIESSIAESSGEPGPDLHDRENGKADIPSLFPVAKDSLLFDTSAYHKFLKSDSEVSLKQAISIVEMMEPQLSTSYPASPPYYQEDLLHRRQNLEEEFIQLSVESFSLASSDSDTSTSDDESGIYDPCSPEIDGVMNNGSANSIFDNNSEVLRFKGFSKDEVPHGQDGNVLLDSCSARIPETRELLQADHFCTDNEVANVNDNNTDNDDNQDTGFSEKLKKKVRLKRRVVSLLDEENVEALTSLKQNGTAQLGIGGMEVEKRGDNMGTSEFQNFLGDKCNTSIESTYSHPLSDEFITNYFNAKMAKSSISEICVRSMLCDCVLQKESEYKESEVVVLLSSANKVYLLLVDTTSDGSETISETIGCHRLEEIKKVIIGIGLQVLRLYIDMDATYLFLTRTVEKSRELLSLLGVCDSPSMSNRCSVMSAEKDQVELFEKRICRDSNMSIFLYSMLLFWCNTSEGESWLSRSMFVTEGYMIVCVEDLLHFGFDSVENALPSSYFSLDSCCSISDISEMVIEPKDSRCVTLTVDSEREVDIEKRDVKTRSGSHKWKLKWFSEEILLKFVALLKALHAETAMYPLTVKCM